MYEDRLLLDYLNDILESIGDIEEFTYGLTLEEFVADKKTTKAVIRCLEVIGEAVNKIPEGIREEYPEAPWAEMVGMRNRLIHEYFGVDMSIVWQTIHEDLEPLLELVKKIAARPVEPFAS
jgi:uncharacterized protein with HEPN domain